MRILHHSESEIELEKATFYYENQQKGLGSRFQTAIDSAIQQISLHPEQYTKVGSHLRRARVKKFPYNIIYLLGQKFIFIIAIAHSKRQQNYWMHRVTALIS